MKQKENIASNAPVVILVRPQLSQNIGMVARAMMNCSLSELRVVLPKEPVCCEASISTASGAQSILKEAIIYDSLEKSLEDINFSLATTARIRDMVKTVYTPIKAAQKMTNLLKKKGKVAYIFGPERTGLENEDLLLSDGLLRIPLNPVHPSLNLAQAVLLVGWSWWQQSQTEEIKIERGVLPAPKKELTLFLKYLEENLTSKGYFCWPDKKERMSQNIENIFSKSALTSSEIKTLYRLVKILSK